ncbi:FAD-dependent monooxygenase [Geodermatophilus poikilotrophus]|uniref:FAD-dependent monooxygenase n=1 Tax=Geodermatophilus poikilotrophus TaxID=1333667 RepID=UPI001114471C
MTTMTTSTEVLVVGAGPTGITLACDLRRRGVDCRALDREFSEQGGSPPSALRVAPCPSDASPGPRLRRGPGWMTSPRSPPGRRRGVRRPGRSPGRPGGRLDRRREPPVDQLLISMRRGLACSGLATRTVSTPSSR